MADDITRCILCGEPMSEGETMFKYHGYWGPCPKPPLPRKQLEQEPPKIKISQEAIDAATEDMVNRGTGVIYTHLPHGEVFISAPLAEEQDEYEHVTGPHDGELDRRFLKNPHAIREARALIEQMHENL